MLKFRAISFPLLLALAAWVVCDECRGPWVFATLAFLAAAAAVLESSALAEKLGLGCFKSLAVAAAWLMLLEGGLGTLLPTSEWEPGMAWVAVLTVPAGMLGLLLARDRALGAKKALGTAGVLAFAIVPVLALSKIYFEYGAEIFLVLVLCTKAADTGGYIVGMLAGRLQKNGNHKIVPSISPKKSWEGTAGAALFSVGTAFIFNHFGFIDLGLAGTGVFGFLAFLGSFAGDLTESQLKRAAEVKDSAHWIPGMGGILDVLDSFIYNAPLFYLALQTGWIVC